MFTVDGINGKPVRVSGIGFIGRMNPDSETGDTAIHLQDVKDFRVDHCYMKGMGGSGVLVSNPNPTLLCQGVVDHCDLLDIYKPATTAARRGYGYGVAVRKEWDVTKCPWEPVSKLFGKYYDNTFIEDCYFKDCRHAIMNFAGGHYVARYNTIQTIDITRAAMHMIDQHPSRGPSTGAWTFSGRCAEVYNNLIEDIEPANGWEHRISGFAAGGGAGVWFNNTLKHLISAFILEGAETAHPEAKKCWTRDLYIWNNTLEKIWYELRLYDNAGPAPTEWDPTSATPEPDAWYSRNPPPQGYTPYTYPHPLIAPLIPPIDLPTIAAGGLAVVDAALVAYYLAKFFKII